jgi:hypothetical protein
MKSKYIIAILVLAAAGYGVWHFSRSKAPSDDVNDRMVPPTQQTDGEGETIVEEVPNALEGELKESNDKRRGNLMLMLKDSDRIIYLNTSRDFSQFIGKQVSVSIEGSLDDFRLLDIKESQ